MKNKQLEKLFLEHIAHIAQYGEDANARENEDMWLLFAQEDFHFNLKNNTLYVKPVDIMVSNVFQEVQVTDPGIQWVAYKKSPVTFEDKLAIGIDNPFLNDALASFTKGHKIVRAVPFQYARRIHKKAAVMDKF